MCVCVCVCEREREREREREANSLHIIQQSLATYMNMHILTCEVLLNVSAQFIGKNG